MKYTGLTYRPPFEANYLLLQVTRGCSHNACSFCTMYRDTPFGEETLEQIERDIDEAAQMNLNTHRAFLVNGDAFCLPAKKLARVAEMMGEKLPQIRTIAMYASIRNIQEKTDEELRMLRGLGINELNIGVESGMDSVLEYMNKGYTAAQAKAELLRLKEAGFDYALNIIFGAAGSGNQQEHARETARLVNDTQPFLIFTGTVHTDPGCPLYDAVREGLFVECTIGEYLEEEERFIADLELERCFYFGLHPSNVIQMQGWLPDDKEEMIAAVRKTREDMKRILDKRPIRAGEGAIIAV